MTALELDHDTRAWLKDQISQKTRELEAIPQAAGAGCGRERRYNDGCRCPSCTAAATQGRVERRARQRERALHVDRTSPRWQRIRDHISATSTTTDPDEQADLVMQRIQKVAA